MRTHATNARGPAAEARPGHSPKETPHHQNLQFSIPVADGYTADDKWCSNLARMARRALREPEFFEIAGGTVQHLASQLQAEVSS